MALGLAVNHFLIIQHLHRELRGKNWTFFSSSLCFLHISSHEAEIPVMLGEDASLALIYYLG